MKGITLILLTIIMLTGCNKDSNQTNDKLTIGVALQPSSSLLQIAIAKDFFKKHNLTIDVKYYPSGKRALFEGLLTQQVDIISVTEIPFIYQRLKKQTVKILATIYMANDVNRIVARKSLGVNQLSDLKGKRLATQKNSAVHYFSHLILAENHIKESEINRIYLKAENLPIGLKNSEFDAFSMREPYVSEAQKLLGDDAVILGSKGLYRQYELLVFNLKTPPSESIKSRVLMALIEAEEFALNYPLEAKKIVAQTLNISIPDIEAVWSTFSLRVELNQALLTTLEQSGLWVAKENEYGITYFDSLPSIDRLPLKQLKPERVSIID